MGKSSYRRLRLIGSPPGARRLLPCCLWVAGGRARLGRRREVRPSRSGGTSVRCRQGRSTVRAVRSPPGSRSCCAVLGVSSAAFRCYWATARTPTWPWPSAFSLDFQSLGSEFQLLGLGPQSLGLGWLSQAGRRVFPVNRRAASCASRSPSARTPAPSIASRVSSPTRRPPSSRPGCPRRRSAVPSAPLRPGRGRPFHRTAPGSRLSLPCPSARSGGVGPASGAPGHAARLAWISPCSTSASAICTALRAAPLRRLSDTHQKARPFGTVGSRRRRET